MSWEREVELARRIAREAGQIALRYWEQGVAAEAKADDSPVTAADRECEQKILAALEQAFPEDGLLGEEGGGKTASNGRLWIIDPIDGTRDFVRGSRMWAVMLALEEAGGVVAGVCHFPALEETYWALRGGGAYQDGRRLRASEVTEIGRAVLCLNDFARLSRIAFAEDLLAWMARFWAVRNLGGSPDAMLVASGRADAWIEPDAKPWDLAPLKLLTEEAGGVFSNFDGASSIYGGNCFTCAPGLEAELRRFVGGGPAPRSWTSGEAGES
jgi:histidinol phosphatase-like enzyme (inositol monophosphatase family)